jgi:diguanylate cyclase (GGDEF)-like protein
MDNFLVFNSLNLFSITLLLLILGHTFFYFNKSKSKFITFWEKTIFYLIIAIVLDTFCWFVNAQVGAFYYYAAFVGNVVLFTAITLFTTQIASFINMSASHDVRSYKRYKIGSWIFVGLNFILSVLSIPFGFIFKIDPVTNVYSRGILYFILVLIILLPLIIVFIELLSKYRKDVNRLIENNKPLIFLIVFDIFFSMFFLILQGRGLIDISLLFPTNALGILCLHLFIITHSISTDFLTGMQNRIGLERYFAKFPKTINSYFAVIFVDMDDLKSINDKLGHMMGDQAIKEFSDIILNEIRYKDFVARIGGDEFVIIKTVTELEHASKLMQAIQRSVDNFNNNGTRHYKLEYSWGLSYTSPRQIIDKQKLLDEADAKMYEVKKTKPKALKQQKTRRKKV